MVISTVRWSIEPRPRARPNVPAAEREGLGAVEAGRQVAERRVAQPQIGVDGQLASVPTSNAHQRVAEVVDLLRSQRDRRPRRPGASGPAPARRGPPARAPAPAPGASRLPRPRASVKLARIAQIVGRLDVLGDPAHDGRRQPPARPPAPTARRAPGAGGAARRRRGRSSPPARGSPATHRQVP